MRVLLVGGGGREAALAWRIAKSPSLTELVVTHDNPGWPDQTTVHKASGVAEIVAAAQGFDLVIVGPEAPLADGLADALQAADIPCFGPSGAAAQLEASKAMAKGVMAAAGVPTAAALVVDPSDPAAMDRARARIAQGNVVVKADGLAAGKGVIVCATPAEGESALAELSGHRFGQAGKRLLVEDRLEGPEVSIFALSDGKRVVPLLAAQDHKQLLDGGLGPNTGGMGAFAPSRLLGTEEVDALVQQVHAPVVAEMARRGTPFRGVLFAGLMLTPTGPQVLEFNVRFGDPECQPLMCLWQDDPLVWLHGAAIGKLPEGRPLFSQGAACCVVLASAGYPASSTKGVPIPEPEPSEGVQVFLAGTRRDQDGTLRTNGGRVLGVTGLGTDLAQARDRAYAALPGWTFEGAQHRTDVGG